MSEITIIDQVKEVAAKSGVPLEIDVTRLATLAARGKAITSVTDPNFYSVKKEMQKTRTELATYFMDARRGFNQLAEGVRDVEKAVLSEFTPEEDRLIALDKAEKERVIKEARLEALPAKKERIVAAGVKFIDEEEILALTDADFELVLATKIAEKAEADRLAAEAKLAEERAAFEAEKAELARKQAEADAIEAARAEERERAEKALQLAKETAEREVADRIARIQQEAKDKAQAEADQIARELAEKEAAEKATAEAKAKQEADEKYQAFLKENNYNKETDILKAMDFNGTTAIYRFVAEFKN